MYVGSRQGYGGTGVFPVWADTPVDLANPGVPEAWAYCIEHNVTARTHVTGNVGDVASYLGSNYFVDPAVQGKVFWVLAHSYPALSLGEFGAAIGRPAIARNDAIEATQYAIWRYTDLNYDAAWNWENADSEAAYWHLVNGANASPALTPADLEVTAGITAPAGPSVSGALVGPFVVSTNQAAVKVAVDPLFTLTDASGNPINPGNVHDGDALYLDLRGSTAAGTATVSVSAVGSSSTGKIISVPNPSGGPPTSGNHAQSIILVAPSTATTDADATVQWAAASVPVIGTSLVDSADQDRVLAWNGGTVVDSVAYQNLVPGTEYTVAGELMRKSDGSATGITGSASFTTVGSSGSVDVTFVVPAGYAGESLVAFEWLFEGAGASGKAIAEHTDIDDAAQTVAVEKQPVTQAGAAAPTAALPQPVTTLPKTGVDGVPALVAMASFALLAGAALVLARSRRRA